jgi:hypothetical protein
MGGREVSPSGFYSRAVEEAANIPQAKGTPQQMRAALLKQGVKPDELKWTGFDDWAKDKPTVTRDEVADFLRRNEVRVEEKTLQKIDVAPRYQVYGAFPAEFSTRTEAEEYVKRFTNPPEGTSPSVIAMLQKKLERFPLTIEEVRPPTQGDPKFSQYTLPGGENYRELLLTRPPATSPKAAEAYELTRRMNDGEFNSLDDVGRQAVFRRRDQLLREAKAEEGAAYRSSHWDDPNVLAHLRMKDRTDPQGRRVLHVEEIQSDWAQEGRKKGFDKPKIDLAPLEAAREAARQQSVAAAQAMIARESGGRFNTFSDVLNSGDPSLLNRVRAARSDPELVRLNNAVHEAERILDAARLNHQSNVPSGPFVESTPKWTDLALKRALYEAAEGGYDALAWTPGAQQAKRFDLSRQIDDIRYVPSADGKKVSIEAYRGGENVFNRPNVPIGDLDAFVGRDVAERIAKGAGETDPNTGYRVLSGLDLQVGSEGMRGYYDKIVPQQLQKLVRPMDPEARFGETRITPYGANQPVDIPTLNITPAMREKIKQGLPLFAAAPLAFGLQGEVLDTGNGMDYSRDREGGDDGLVSEALKLSREYGP